VYVGQRDAQACRDTIGVAGLTPMLQAKASIQLVLVASVVCDDLESCLILKSLRVKLIYNEIGKSCDHEHVKLTCVFGRPNRM
jgi:hypothetical protein